MKKYQIKNVSSIDEEEVRSMILLFQKEGWEIDRAMEYKNGKYSIIMRR